MTSPGIYKHHKGGLYSVLFVAEESTNARAGRVVVYVSMTTGRVHVRDETEFEEIVVWPETPFPFGPLDENFIPAGARHPRFMSWPRPEVPR